MRIPDAQLGQWYRLVLDEDVAGRRSPRGEARARAVHRHALARGGRLPRRQRRTSRASCVRDGLPTTCPRRALPEGDPVHLPALLAELFGVSTSEARRLLEQGAVRVNDEVVTELDLPRERLAGALLQAGKRRYVRFPPA